MKNLRRFLMILMLGCGVIWMGTIEVNDVSAASTAGFEAGYIISDYQMGNYNSMSEAQIQNFLTSKNSCGNRDYNYYLQLSANRAYSWHWANGHFVCLSEERFGDGETIGLGESAAHIIWQAAQDYRINPQVLIATLQKETSLVTDPIPNNADYRRAMGFGCPDSAMCSSRYYGFKNQVRNAAALFREVMDGGWSNYPVGNNYIAYSPSTACGGSVVNVRNRATSALYRYTPYQPNAGALAAGYGTAYCGSYGNRNFYLYFQDWFGDTKSESLRIPESSFVAEGEYVIKTKLGGGKALDVNAASTANGANIQIYAENGTIAQKWQVKNNGDRTYTLTNPASGKALDVNGAGRANGTNVQLYASNGTCAQKWKITRSDDGSYTLYSACSGMAMDVSGGSTANGANVQIYSPNNTNAQKWYFVPSQTVANGEYTISSSISNSKVIDVNGGGVGNGANVQLYSSNDSQAQRWQVKMGSDGYYTITNPNSGKVLDVSGAGTSDGTNVQIYAGNGTCAQKWQIMKNSNGTYTLYSACSGKALDVSGASSANGTNIQIYGANGTVAQKWKFNLAHDAADGYYNIRTMLNTRKSVDIEAARDANGTNIQIYDNNGTVAQRWRIRLGDDGYYTVMNPTTKKVLDVSGAGKTNGTNVQLYASNGTCAQKWQIVKNKEGSYEFYSACSGLAMDVQGWSTANGTNVQIYDINNGAAQKWKLVKY